MVPFGKRQALGQEFNMRAIYCKFNSLARSAR